MQMEIIDGDFPAQTVKINKKGKHYKGAGFIVWGQDKKPWAYSLRNGLQSYEVLAEEKKKKTTKIVLRDGKVFIAVVEDNVLEAFKIAQALPPEENASVSVEIKGKWLVWIQQHKRLVTYSLLAWLVYSVGSCINDLSPSPHKTQAELASEAKRDQQQAEQQSAKKAEQRIERARTYAITLCQNHVRQKLNVPRSASFPSFPDMPNTSSTVKGTLYVHRSIVTSKNMYGVELESRYRCKIILKEGDYHNDANWELVSVEFFDN